MWEGEREKECKWKSETEKGSAGALPCKVSFCVDGHQKEVPKDFYGWLAYIPLFMYPRIEKDQMKK